MVKSSFLRWLASSAVAGLVVPIAILLAHEVVSSNKLLMRHFYNPLYRVMQIAWPSSFFLMATDGGEGTPEAYLIIAISILANILLYSVVGCVLWGVARAIVVARGK